MHYGNVATSKLEGSHALMKKFLRHLRGDLLTVVFNTKRHRNNTIATIQQRPALDRQAPLIDTHYEK